MKKIRILCDPMLAFMGSVLILSIIVYYSVIIMAVNAPFVSQDYFLIAPKTFKDYLGWGFVWILVPVFSAVTYLSCVPQWFAFVELDERGIRLNRIYQRSTMIPYSSFGYFQIASYMHIIQKRYFLLMGTSGVSFDKLAKINEMKSSDKLIKIKLSHRVCKKLLLVLPAVQKEKLESALNSGLSSAAFDVECYQRRIDQVEKQKQRKKHKR